MATVDDRWCDHGELRPARYGWMSETSVRRHRGNRWGPVSSRDRPATARCRSTRARGRSDRDADGARRAHHQRVVGATAIPLAEQITGDVRRPLLVLFAAVALLFLMSAVNVALDGDLCRRRSRELSVRRSARATPSRLIRTGDTKRRAGLRHGIAGIGIAFGASRALVGAMPPDVRVSP